MTSNVGLNTSLTYIYPIPRLMYKRTSDLVWRHITPHVVVRVSSIEAGLAVTGLNRQQSLYIVVLICILDLVYLPFNLLITKLPLLFHFP